jgi:hypothetical protein
MTHSKNLKQIMIYMSPEEDARFTKYSKITKTPKTVIAREGIRMRMSGDKDPYNRGFNDGLNKAMEIALVAEGAQMAFPSGRTFAQVVCDDIMKYLRDKKND